MTSPPRRTGSPRAWTGLNTCSRDNHHLLIHHKFVNTIGKIPATRQDVETAIEKAVDTMADMIGTGFTHTDKRFDAIESRLGRIEHLLLAEQKREIEDLKKRMKKLEDALAV